MRTFDVAIAGAGGIASVHAASLDPRMRLVAIAEVSGPAREAFAAKWSVERAYATLDDLLASESPDLVSLCTPPGLHFEQAMACLDKGLTVLCEKPPALSLSELDRLAAAGGDRFATVSQHRFGGGAMALRSVVQEGCFGDPMTVVCHTLWYRPDSYFAVPWRGSFEQEGGGPTMGHGIHQMDLMLSVLGPWESVIAVAVRRARPTATEDLSHAIVTFESGAVASVVNSLLSPRETSYLRFDFANATVELSHLYGYGDGDWKVTAVPGFEHEVAAAWSAGLAGRSRPSGHGAQFGAVLDAIQAGLAPPVGVGDARATLELIAAVYASAHGGRAVRRGEIGPDSPFYHRMDGGFGVASDQLG